MYRAKHSILALLMMAIFMTSCNDNLMDIESDIISTNSLEPMTRSMSDSICEEDATILEETDELKILKEISDQLKSSKKLFKFDSIKFLWQPNQSFLQRPRLILHNCVKGDGTSQAMRKFSRPPI